MPMHDWTRVEAGIYHDFHLQWTASLSRRLNGGILPADYYAMAEQHVGRFGPDVITLRGGRGDSPEATPANGRGEKGVATKERPRTKYYSELEEDFYVRKRNSIAIRHVSNDELAAIIEILSPGNKSSEHAIRQIIDKAHSLLENNVHILLIDPFPPTPRDPFGIHYAIWGGRDDIAYRVTSEQPLTLACYECGDVVRVYIEPLAVGDSLPSMPLFLEPDFYVDAPLEATYSDAYSAVPRRWREVVEG